MARIAINGFGRIGRCVLRAAIERGEKDLEFVSINDLTDTKTLAHLLKYDSVHGVLDAEVKATATGIVVNGKEIQVTAIKNPAELPHAANKVDLVHRVHRPLHGPREGRDPPGRRRAAGAHLRARPPTRTSPSPSASTTRPIDKAKHKIISNASCTTNCLAPVAKVLLETFGIERGLMTTIHSYTNDQNLLDLPHKDLRRARAAALSMIPSTTGAAKAVAEVLPALKGKLDGCADPRADAQRLAGRPDRASSRSRPPTRRSTPRSRRPPPARSRASSLYTEEPTVSIDYNGNPHSLDLRRHQHHRHRRRHLRQGLRLVRQRVGLLEPHGRRGQVPAR